MRLSSLPVAHPTTQPRPGWRSTVILPPRGQPTYFDPQPFPKFKDGVGLLLQLSEPTVLSAVTIDLNSTGTVAQIRTSTGPTPAKLADTFGLTPPSPLQPGHNVIPVKASTSTGDSYWSGSALSAAPAGRVTPTSRGSHRSKRSPVQIGLAIDRDPGTAWSTDAYFDPKPFPKFKHGLGLLVQLPGPTSLSAVTVDLNSSGTVVQIRASSGATPRSSTTPLNSVRRPRCGPATTSSPKHHPRQQLRTGLD